MTKNPYEINKFDPVYDVLLANAHCASSDEGRREARAFCSNHPIGRVFRERFNIRPNPDAVRHVIDRLFMNVFEETEDAKTYRTIRDALEGRSYEIERKCKELVADDLLTPEQAEAVITTAHANGIVREMWAAQSGVHMLTGGIISAHTCLDMYTHGAERSRDRLNALGVPLPTLAEELLEQIPHFRYTAGAEAAERYMRQPDPYGNMTKTHHSLAQRAATQATAVLEEHPDAKRLSYEDTELPWPDPRGRPLG